jgi:hypothetical protein
MDTTKIAKRRMGTLKIGKIFHVSIESLCLGVERNADWTSGRIPVYFMYITLIGIK